MFISIDRKSSSPVYQQIRDGIVALIKAGTLNPGDKLPGTRELATQLEVSRKTVLQAYLELAADSWVETHPGSCTYVLDRAALIKGAGYNLPAATPTARDGVGKEAAGDSDTPRMDWGPYQIDGRFFRMPWYHKKWQGEEEWIAFSRAIPDARLFPFERIKKVSSQLLWDPQAFFFDYGNPQGYMPLLEYIEMQLAKEGVVLGDDNDLVICSGFQMSLNLLISMLLKPGELVAVEEPTFNSIINLLKAREIPCRGVPMEHDGMDVDYLERLLTRQKPRLIITIPTLHNPTGVVMSLEKRRRLLELAQSHGVPIIEDQWAMLLGHDGKYEPSLKALDSGGHVFQIGSFSKSFLPGTRVAWVALPSELGLSFLNAKRAMDRSDSYFLQTIVNEFIKKGFMELHLRKMERIYRGRRELMDELMRTHFPSEVSWKKPTGGFSYWIKLPESLNSRLLLKEALKAGVDFAPGNYFNVSGRDTNTFRLAFSTLTQPQIRQGIKRLGLVIRKAIKSGLPDDGGGK